jgi:putative hydrolase of the HAD superfamily
MLDHTKIKNIIFDLGGVILNLDYQITVNAFERIGLNNPEDMFSKKSQTNFFDDFETGKILAQEFRNEIKKLISKPVSDQQINDAWNAMLLDFPLHRFEFLESIKSKKRIFLLSNTNEIHMSWFKNYVNNLFGNNVFFDLFEVAYLSNEMGMRKPNTEIFNAVIEQNNLIPNETLFIDDSPQHVDGAKKAGLQSYWLKNDEDITDLLRYFLA